MGFVKLNLETGHVPRSRDPDTYPAVFEEVLRAAYNSRDIVRWPVESIPEAKRIRQQLYAYIRALKAQEEAEFLDRGLQKGRLFQKVNIKVESLDGRPHLTLYNKDYTPALNTIRGIIKDLDTTDHQTAEHMARVRAAMSAQPEELEPAPVHEEESIASRLFGSTLQTNPTDEESK